jgi:hypothetical protein
VRERGTDRERQRERDSKTERHSKKKNICGFVNVTSTNNKHLENCELTISITLRSHGRYDNPPNVNQTNDN